MMDAAIVRMLLQSIIDGDLTQYDESEQRAALRWLRDRIYVTPRDKGAKRQHMPEIENAAREMQEALTRWHAGDKEGAKQSALAARKRLTGN
jgi:hypothetical protein